MPTAYTLENFEIQDRAKKLMEEGRRKSEKGDHSSANRVLSMLLDQYPYAGDREEASCLLLQGLLEEQKWDEGERVIKKLKESDPDPYSQWLACALLVEGQIYEQRGKMERAIPLYRQVIQISVGSKWANRAEDLLIRSSF